MEFLKSLILSDVLFLDIETVSQQINFEALKPEEKALWENKARYLTRENETASDIYDRASIYAEFGRIVCIGIGFFMQDAPTDRLLFRVKSIYGHDEVTLLKEMAELLNTYFSHPRARLCAHNGKEFDFPYIARRMLINGITLPKILDVAGKKPWETNFIDTMELWKFGDYKNFTSLNLLASIFGLPTPKDDIDGSMVGEVYWKDNNLDRIARYCVKDVVTLARIFLKYRDNSILKEDSIILL